MEDIVLDVPYYSQRDNRFEPYRTCNVSSHAMVCEFIKPGSFNGSDDNYAKELSRWGDTTDHSAHSKLLEANGFKSQFRYNLNYENLNASLCDRKMPVVIGVLHRGNLYTPYGGHMLVVIGKKGNDYICHDPWGEPFSYKSNNGKNCVIPTLSLDHRWLADGPKSGWGRLFF